ncbi:MAG: chromosome partitioning protein [Candidatus Paceibacter sp.]|jgi:ParB family chromosome partitioning protein|nr:chromosome partitioning protein [Candidatus Paceibacter sp.]
MSGTNGNGLALVKEAASALLHENEVAQNAVPSTPGPNDIVKSGETYLIPIAMIRRYVDQPRQYFDPEAIKDLSRSLKKGQRNPIKVIRIEDDPDHKFELDDGECRWRAAKLAGITHLDALIVKFHSKNEQFVDSVVSNLQRSAHTPIEKAEALGKLREFGMTRTDIADLCGYSPGWVDQHLSLLKLEPEVRALMDPERPKEKQLPYQHALRLAGLPADMQKSIAREIVNKKVPVKDAQYLITGKTHEAGKSVAQREPSRDFRIVTGFIERTMNESRLVADMPDGVYVGMLGTRTDADVRVMTGQIDTMINNLVNLKQKLLAAKQAVNDRVTL